MQKTLLAPAQRHYVYVYVKLDHGRNHTAQMPTMQQDTVSPHAGDAEDLPHLQNHRGRWEYEHGPSYSGEKTVTSKLATLKCARCGHEVSLARSAQMYVVRPHEFKRCRKTWFPGSHRTPNIRFTCKTTLLGHTEEGKKSSCKLLNALGKESNKCATWKF